VWAASPQAAAFTGTEWLELQQLAVLVDAYWRGDAKVASEVRQRQARLGSTAEDRLRLRWEIVDDPADGGDQADAGSRSRRARDPRHLSSVPETG
jgi:hypothetical protein